MDEVLSNEGLTEAEHRKKIYDAQGITTDEHGVPTHLLHADYIESLRKGE